MIISMIIRFVWLIIFIREDFMNKEKEKVVKQND